MSLLSPSKGNDVRLSSHRRLVLAVLLFGIAGVGSGICVGRKSNILRNNADRLPANRQLIATRRSVAGISGTSKLLPVIHPGNQNVEVVDESDLYTPSVFTARRDTLLPPVPEDIDRELAHSELTMENAAAYVNERITPAWLDEIRRIASGASTYREKIRAIQQNFIHTFGPDIGPTDRDYNDYCSVVTPLNGRTAYPYNAIMPVWARLYDEVISSLLRSGDAAEREQAFVLTLGIEVRISVSVPRRADIPTALDVAMGRNTNSYSDTVAITSPRYDLVMQWLSGKLAHRLETRGCQERHVVNEEAQDLEDISREICNHYPAAISYILSSWWTPLRREVFINTLRQNLDPLMEDEVRNQSRDAIHYLQSLHL